VGAPGTRTRGASTEALGYIERVEPLLLQELDQVRAILARVVM
jgi:hypothetical protein